MKLASYNNIAVSFLSTFEIYQNTNFFASKSTLLIFTLHTIIISFDKLLKIKFNPYCIVAMKKRDKDISKEVDCDTTQRICIWKDYDKVSHFT